MGDIGIRELKQKTSEVLRRVREEKESYTITYRGRVVARLIPAAQRRTEDWRAVWADMDELAKEVSKRWPRGLSPEDAIAEDRR